MRRQRGGKEREKEDAPDVTPEVNHSITSQLNAMNIQNGMPQMNGWQRIVAGGCDAASNYRCISGYHLPRQEPSLSALASKFAISDNTFSLADSPSWGGHLYVVTSNLDGFPGNIPQPAPGQPRDEGWGCDSSGTCTQKVIAPDGLQTCKKADGGSSWAICPTIGQCLYRDAHHIANPDTFVKDARAGTLPSFSVITPSGCHVADSEHNGFSITAGDD
jgi:hypothetical protein